jgi:WD40 repeat protein
MTEYRSVLERARSNFRMPDLPLEGVLRRRERRQRNQRIAAGIVGLLIAIAAAAGGATLLRSDPRPADDEQPSLAPILREGEILEVGRGRFLAVDRLTGDRRSIAPFGCGNPNEDACNMVLYRHAMSVDGRWVAYDYLTCIYHLPCNPEAGIWVANALGEEQQLTQCEPDGCTEEPWAWSPVGATLAVYQGGDVSRLFTIDPLSGDRIRIASSSVDVSAIAWSPDGTSIAYAADGLHVVDLGSGESTLLTNLVGDVHNIAWSPDGTQLVLDDDLGGFYRIVVVEAVGSDLRVLVEQADQALQSAPPAWSPDGTRIAYISTDHTFEVWVIRADGSDTTRLFHADCCSGRPEDGPFWAPDGSRIAFAFLDTKSLGWLVANADGTGSPEQIDEFAARSWRAGG